MSFLKWVGKRFKSFFNVKTISQVIIERTVVEDCITFAKENYPQEFVAILSGQVKDETLVITGLLYQHFTSSTRSAHMKMDLPLASGSVGSVHSHPSSHTRPSMADIRFFNKRGYVHFIIGYPYTQESLSCYDFQGNPLEYSVQ